MKRYATSIRIDAPLEDVFSVFSDLSKSAKCLSRVQRVETLSEPQSGLNATYREWRVLESGREIVQDFRVVHIEPEKRCTFESVSGGIRFTFTTVFHQVSNQAEVSISVTAQGLTFLTKLLLPVVWVFAAGEAKRSLAHDLEEVKACLERNPGGD